MDYSETTSPFWTSPEDWKNEKLRVEELVKEVWKEPLTRLILSRAAQSDK